MDFVPGLSADFQKRASVTRNPITYSQPDWRHTKDPLGTELPRYLS
jgi:hypothetical protein